MFFFACSGIQLVQVPSGWMMSTVGHPTDYIFLVVVIMGLVNRTAFIVKMLLWSAVSLQLYAFVYMCVSKVCM